MKNNSVKQIIDYLSLTMFASENKIMEDVFGYDRNNSYHSNKKYAEMLRRALKKGTINRFITKFEFSDVTVRSRCFYYVGPKASMDILWEMEHEKMQDFAIQNEGKRSKNIKRGI